MSGRASGGLERRASHRGDLGKRFERHAGNAALVEDALHADHVQPRQLSGPAQRDVAAFV